MDQCICGHYECEHDDAGMCMYCECMSLEFDDYPEDDYDDVDLPSGDDD